MNDWLDYSQREPFGFPAADMINAHLCLLVAAVMGNKDAKPVDFMVGPGLLEAAKERLLQQMPEEKAEIERVLTLFGGPRAG